MFFEVWNPGAYHGWYQYAAACAFYALVIIHVYVKSSLFDVVKEIVVDVAKDFASGDGFKFVTTLVLGAVFVALILALVMFSAFFWPLSIPYMSSVAFGHWRRKRTATQ